jgi:hypothetical protein
MSRDALLLSPPEGIDILVGLILREVPEDLWLATADGLSLEVAKGPE